MKEFGTPNTTAKVYIFNGRFEVKSTVRTIVNGFPEMVQKRNNRGELLFDPVEKDVNFSRVDGYEDKKYKSWLGPRFHSKSVFSSICAQSMTGALRRITAKRLMEGRPTYHDDLRQNQYTFVSRDNPEVNALKKELQKRLKARLDEVTESAGRLRYEWAHKAHKKRKMRVRNHLVSNFEGIVHSTHAERVAYMIKPMEELPADKYMRAIGDLGVAASARAAYFIDYVKEIMTESYYVDDVECVFISGPRPDDLRDAFSKLLQPPGCGYFCFFSDDSCFSYRCMDGIFTCNMDIKAADGSNFKPIFSFLKEVMDVDARFAESIEQVFLQCWLPARVRNPEDFSEYIDLVPTGDPVLYSGSTLTTLINNVANLMIILAILKDINSSPLTKAQLRVVIERAAESAGYTVTCDICEIPEDIQFLKYSVSVIDDEVVPYLNLGAWMLKFGSFDGDLPGSDKISVLQKSIMFNSDVVKGRLRSGNHIIADAFKTMIVGETLVGLDDRYDDKIKDIVAKSEGSLTTRIPLDRIAARYGCDPVEIEELASLIVEAGQGDLVHHPVLSTIFQRDYGI